MREINMGRRNSRKAGDMNRKAKIGLVLIISLISLLAYNIYPAYAYIGTGQMVYNNNTTTPQARTYTVSSNTFLPGVATVAGGTPSWVKVVAGKARNESVVAYVDTANTLRILYWNGAWSAAAPHNWTAALGASGASGRGFDIAVEKLSGDIVVAYTTNAAGTEINYRIWNGSTWAAAVGYDSARLTGTVRFIKMESKPNSDDIALIMADTNNDLSAAIWNGTTNAWGNAPTAVLTNDLAFFTAGAVDEQSFDLAYEGLSGDLLVAYATDAETTGLAYNTFSGGSWSALTRYANMAEAFENVDCAGDPLSDNIICAAVGTLTQDMRVGVWSGTAWQGTNTDVDTSSAPATFVVGRRYLSVGWLTSGATKKGIIVYNDNNATGVTANWYIVDTNGTFTLGTDSTVAPVPVGGIAYHDIIMDPVNNDRFLYIFQDTTNFDIFAKRLIMDSGGAFTWSDANAGIVINAAPTTAASQAFHIAYDEYYNLNVGNGTDPADLLVGQSSTNNALDSFTMQMASGSGTVTSLVVTGSTNFTATNIPTNGVKVWRDLGTVGVYDSGVDVQISSASSAIASNATTVTISSEAVTTTSQNYLVTVDMTAGATLTQSFTGTVTSVSGTGIPGVRYQDTSSATLTVTAKNLTVSNGTNPVNKNAQRSSTNNALDGFSTVMSASGASTVTSMTVTGSANFTATNIPTNGVKVWRDTGTTPGWWDAGDVLISSASTAIAGNATTVTISSESVTTTAQSYLVTVDITAGATLTQSFTGTVTAAAGTGLGTPIYADSSSATLTVNKLSAAITSCGSCHAYPPYDATTRDPVSGAFVGDHQKHQYICSTCHVAPATETSADYNHRNANINMQPGATGISSGYYDKIASGTYTAGEETWAQTNAVTTASCRNISCHGPNNPTPQWGVGSATCTECHGGVTAIPSPVAASLDASVTTRRPIVSEFASTWSHKRSASGSVTAGDCIVCHMEGVKATLSTDPAYHANGLIDLRDPDTGTQVMQVSMSGDGGTWNQTTTHTAAGSYSPTATPLQFVRFSRTISTRLEAETAVNYTGGPLNWQVVTAIQINHCLKCHDNNGASSANAQKAGGSAFKPFGTTITGHVSPYNANGNGNVVDVNGSFATTNATYHPVRGRQNNSYTQGTQMIAPWNMTKTNGNNTQFGYVLSCWDCHAPAGASGTLTSTVTAHGATATLRAPVKAAGTTAATNLCVNCHATSYSTTAGFHNASASAFGTGSGNMNATTMSNCAYCHANGPANQASGYQTSTARPLRGEDVHGFDDRTAGTPGSLFLTTGAKPHGFFRGSLEQWRPASGTGLVTGATVCTGNGGVCNNNMGGDVYTPGGAY